ncbi:membrane fusion protein, multidrug efflux system [Paracoccus halophilus]|uniref:Membrane fusion protein, multidrug efflux system n=1 Tax=Paracoccus halophilus TaxID=376733 RepID=A0A1I0SNU3_9RHOB|nr:efflux RND transporter periplasmic adaptor subunit [Paracoccus halophilus]SFA41087.1 membrane fusion protein, multidrug efflux system [Paracoccus halophilus]
MRIVKIILTLIVVLAAAGGGMYLTDRILARQGEQTAMLGPGGNRDPLVVETVAAGVETFAERVRAVGTARARQALELVPESSGRIAEIRFESGDSVEAGQVLLLLDDRAEQADLKSAEATLAEAQAAFARQEKLNRSGSASDAAYQTARATLLRAEAERDRARIALDDRSLRAPFSGIVGLTDLVEGQMVETSTIITTLDDLSVIEVDFSVPEALLPRLRPGQQVDLTSAAWPGRIFRAGISRIDTRVDAATRSIALKARIENDDRALSGGMFLQAELLMGERRNPAVPERALTVEGANTYVMVAQDGVVRRVSITTGQQRDGRVEVTSGLPPSARVIVTNLHRIAPGMAIEERPQLQPPEVAATPKAAPVTGEGG